MTSPQPHLSPVHRHAASEFFRGAIACIALLALEGAALAQSAPFHRGDANADSRIDVSDGIETLSYLFIGGATPPCMDSADANDDGAISIADPIVLLSFLFIGQGEIPFPGPGDACGQDPTPDALGCNEFEPCRTTTEIFSSTGSGDIRQVRWIFAETDEFLDVTYELINGLAIVDGDIILGTEDDFIANPTANALAIRAGRQFRWPNGVIPFEIDEDADGNSWLNPQVIQQRIQLAVTHWNQNTSIRLVPRANDEPDYVTFVASDEGCSSYVGRKRGQQKINIIDQVDQAGNPIQCSLGSIIHEIGHAVGLWHEQSRCDRSDWVDVLDQNIQPGKEHNFEKLCGKSLDVGPYDYGSIMHYGLRDFGIVSQGFALPTLRPRQPVPPGVTIGQRLGLSPGDIAGVNLIYSLPQIWIEDFAFLVGSWRVDQHIRVLADVNGDGRQDIVGFGDRAVIVSVALPTGDGFTPPASWVEGFAPLAGGWHVDRHPRLLGDINGDGMDDVVGFGDDGVWVSISTGSGFRAPEFWLADFGFASGWRVDQHIRLLSDVNGDGLQDIVGFGGPGVLVALSTGGGFTAPTFWVEDFGVLAGGWFLDRHPRMLGDVNGDGLPDVVGFGDDGVFVSTSTGAGFSSPALWVEEFGAVAGGWQVANHPRMLGDINGDGMQDVVGFANEGVWVSYSTGSSFTTAQLLIADFGFTAGGWRVERHPRMLADMNGDGRQDVVGFGEDGVWVSTSTGSGFRPLRLWIDDFGFSAGGWRIDRHLRMLGDITGDGKADLAAFGDYGVFVLRSGVPVILE